MEESRPRKRKQTETWDFAPGQPKPDVFTRAGGENRRPPTAPQGTRGRKQAAEGSKSGPGGGRKGPSSSIYSEELRRKQEKFDLLRPENIRNFCEYTPKLLDLRSEETAAVADIKQRAVKEVEETMLEEPCRCCNGKIKVVGYRTVEVIKTAYRFNIKVAELKCDGAACTRGPFSVEPIVAGCAPSSPTIDCPKWFSLSCLHLFSDLHYHNGVSGAGRFTVFIFYFKIPLLSSGSVTACAFLQPTATQWTTWTGC